MLCLCVCVCVVLLAHTHSVTCLLLGKWFLHGQPNLVALIEAICNDVTLAIECTCMYTCCMLELVQWRSCLHSTAYNWPLLVLG